MSVPAPALPVCFHASQETGWVIEGDPVPGWFCKNHKLGQVTSPANLNKEKEAT